MSKSVRANRFRSFGLWVSLLFPIVILGILIFSLYNEFLWPGGMHTKAPEIRLWLMVTLSGALGSFVRSTFDISLLAVRKIEFEAALPSWALQLLRAFVGAAAAALAFFLFFGSVLPRHGIGRIGDVNLFGTITLAVLVGFFSINATNKMQEVFETLFRPSDKSGRATASTHVPGANLASAEDLPLETELRDRLRRTPQDASIARDLIAVLRRSNKFDEAALIYDALISNDPDNDKLILEKAKFYREIGDERRYVETVTRAEQILAQRAFLANVGKKITLREVEIRDLQFFSNFKWELQPTVNVLLGKNGYGKSHLLRCIVAMLQNDKQITNDFFENSGREAMIRVDVQKPDARESTIRTRLLFDKSFGKVPVLALPDMRYIEKSGDTFGPPTGAVTDLRSQGAEHFMRDQSLQGMIQTFLYDLCLEYYSAFKLPVLQAVQKAVQDPIKLPIFQLIEKTIQDLTGGTFRFQEIQRRDNARFQILVLTDGNESKPLPLQKASQGTLSVLSMVGLTYRYLRGLYPSVSQTELTKQQAIVVIDEIDAHLHPASQQKILQLFRDTFPNVQFIVTAHTPLVVAGCKEREVAVLQKVGDKFGVTVMQDHFIGATAATMYQRIFEIEEKDLTYLRLNTLLSDKETIQKKVADLEGRQNLSAAQQTNLSKFRNELYYLNEVDQVNAERNKVAKSESDRQMLEMETLNLRGELSRLKNELESRKRLDEARTTSGFASFLRGFLEANPGQAGVVEAFSKYLSRHGGHAEAASFLEGLLELQPDNPNYLKGLAVQYQSMANYEKAAAILRRALSLSPQDTELRSALSNLEMIQKESTARRRAS
jgi:tetratricopeptide (TPR) repeat protein